ncbi:MAG: sporulation regulator [Mesorhizobium sp. SCN 65-20]|nr:MAG: sporulation regulator [Mesorhizobium sp. SCN 65-20]
MRVTTKGQVTIPKEIRDRLGIEPGSEVEFVVSGDVVTLVALEDDEARRRRAQAINAWADKVAGTIDLGGMTTDEYMEWLRGPRDDLGPR